MSVRRLTLIRFLAAYAVALVVMGALDAIWLGWLAKSFYQQQLGALMSDSVRIVPAAIYYVGFPLVIVYLALMPSTSLGEALRRSAVLGLAAFGVYDLTNLATLRGYTVLMTVVDMAWGTLATALGGGAAYHVVIARAANGQTINAPR